jgi:hypothetical protein
MLIFTREFIEHFEGAGFRIFSKEPNMCECKANFHCTEGKPLRLVEYSLVLPISTMRRRGCKTNISILSKPEGQIQTKSKSSRANALFSFLDDKRSHHTITMQRQDCPDLSQHLVAAVSSAVGPYGTFITRNITTLQGHRFDNSCI